MTFLKNFLEKGYGRKFPILSPVIRWSYYNLLSPILVFALSPIKIWGDNKLYLPFNGICYIAEGTYEAETVGILEKELKAGDVFIDAGGGWIFFCNCF